MKAVARTGTVNRGHANGRYIVHGSPIAKTTAFPTQRHYDLPAREILHGFNIVRHDFAAQLTSLVDAEDEAIGLGQGGAQEV